MKSFKAWLAEADEQGYYVVDGVGGNWTYVAGPFKREDEAKSHLSPDDDYVVKYLDKRPKPKLKVVEAKPEFINTVLDREIQRQHNASRVGQSDDVKAKNAYSRGFRGAFGGRGADDTGITNATAEHFNRGKKDGAAARKRAGEVPAPFIVKNSYGDKKPNQAFEKMVKAAMAEYQKVSEAKSTHKDGDMVEPHQYSVKLLNRGPGRWPTLKGEIYEKDVMIGTFSRKAVKDGFVPPIEYKFRSEASKARFDDFADSLSIEETIEALLPKKVFEARAP